MDRSKNPWHQFVQENPEVLEVDFVIKVNEKTSLTQEFDMLKENMDAIFDHMTVDMTDKCNVLGSVHMGFQGQTPKAKQFECSDADRLLGLVFQVNKFERICIEIF